MLLIESFQVWNHSEITLRNLERRVGWHRAFYLFKNKIERTTFLQEICNETILDDQPGLSRAEPAAQGCFKSEIEVVRQPTQQPEVVQQQPQQPEVVRQPAQRVKKEQQPSEPLRQNFIDQAIEFLHVTGPASVREYSLMTSLIYWEYRVHNTKVSDMYTLVDR